MATAAPPASPNFRRLRRENLAVAAICVLRIEASHCRLLRHCALDHNVCNFACQRGEDRSLELASRVVATCWKHLTERHFHPRLCASSGVALRSCNLTL